MALEIERKFLVKSDLWRHAADGGTVMKQGYFDTASGTTVRVRIAGEKAFLTIKGRTTGVTRSEFEYPVPVADAEAMLTEFCTGRMVTKVRYAVIHDGHTWEVDEFTGDNAGLLTAEIELESENQTFAIPEWLGADVSDNPAYRNGTLARRPFCKW